MRLLQKEKILGKIEKKIHASVFMRNQALSWYCCLPHRQFRNPAPPFVAIKYSCLPHRQFRKTSAASVARLICCLPHRQFRKLKGGGVCGDNKLSAAQAV